MAIPSSYELDDISDKLITEKFNDKFSKVRLFDIELRGVYLIFFSLGFRLRKRLQV